MSIPPPAAGTITTITGNAATAIRLIPAGSVHMVACSPPYWGQRNYDLGDDETGRPGQDLEAYIGDLVDVGLQLWDATTDDAVWFLNIGDVAIGSGGSGGDYNDGGRYAGRPKARQGKAYVNGHRLKSGGLGLVPYRVALALADRGWMIRSTIAWDKGRVRPEDVRHVKRPLYRWEPIFMLTKQVRCRWRSDLPIPDVWTVRTGSTRRAETGHHQAPWPGELVATMLNVATEPGDTVLDPYAGSGTTPVIAAQNGRAGIGIDLDPATPATCRTRAPGVPVAAYRVGARGAAVLVKPPGRDGVPSSA